MSYETKSLTRKTAKFAREMNREFARMTEIFYLSENISVGRVLRKSFWGQSFS